MYANTYRKVEFKKFSEVSTPGPHLKGTEGRRKGWRIEIWKKMKRVGFGRGGRVGRSKEWAGDRGEVG